MLRTFDPQSELRTARGGPTLGEHDAEHIDDSVAHVWDDLVVEAGARDGGPAWGGRGGVVIDVRCDGRIRLVSCG